MSFIELSDAFFSHPALWVYAFFSVFCMISGVFLGWILGMAVSDLKKAKKELKKIDEELCKLSSEK